MGHPPRKRSKHPVRKKVSGAQDVGSQNLSVKGCPVVPKWTDSEAGLDGLDKMRIFPLRTSLVSEGRSDVKGDLYWTRTYVTPTGREVVVKTVMEMERVDGTSGPQFTRLTGQ
jgi:hypothetical protein